MSTPELRRSRVPSCERLEISHSPGLPGQEDRCEDLLHWCIFAPVVSKAVSHRLVRGTFSLATRGTFRVMFRNSSFIMPLHVAAVVRHVQTDMHPGARMIHDMVSGSVTRMNAYIYL